MLRRPVPKDYNRLKNDCIQHKLVSIMVKEPIQCRKTERPDFNMQPKLLMLLRLVKQNVEQRSFSRQIIIWIWFILVLLYQKTHLIFKVTHLLKILWFHILKKGTMELRILIVDVSLQLLHLHLRALVVSSN